MTEQTRKETHPDGLTRRREPIVLHLSVQMPYVKTAIADVTVETTLDKVMQEIKQTLAKAKRANVKPGDRVSWLIDGKPASNGNGLLTAVVVSVSDEGVTLEDGRAIGWDAVTMPW